MPKAVRAVSKVRINRTSLSSEYAPDLYPEVDEHGRKHFGRVMMESAAQAIRDAWADAIKDVENAERARQIAAEIP